MNLIKFSFTVMLFCLSLQSIEGFIYRLITETLQNNVAGEPLTHVPSTWDFDPTISQKRRALYYETHGFRSAKFIERIGLGIDGHEDDRRVEQQVRDAGRLNGEHNINFPPNT
ncbi:uncharacterized protein LOC119674732 [Teleopsis dalmanni]|uniref:uncharacterized protein LOC119674510 n=1 Tax=Teleopsis dalmanni TaxID=139649 RepID=UPI000D32B88C|nr:uncharacterized protein LOC119674510 [Teleopsis dalmanni]XP_037941815.1 uncharacterized protein LOC119674732 [Teleopsis dalmanni]